MKRIAIMLSVALALTFAPAVFAQSFSAVLTGANEVPAADPDGSGIAVVTIDGTTVNYSVLVQGIGTPTVAHIHRGAIGVSGPPVLDLNAGTLANGTVSGVAQALIDEIVANPTGFYV
ncbi:MAG TPA: CHRD domain-containing protein, partial [Thermoanaerobaculia bacterium]